MFKLAVGLLLGCIQCLVFGDIIRQLPGLDTPINFKQYSGYITVDPANGTRLFYWYVESQSNPSTDPLVLWLNGGPGCSSLGGFLGELGPFYVKPNLTLGINEYSWNKIANMLFLEAPAGVGFSKTDQPKEYFDDNTAADSFIFLLNFFQKYPHLKSHDFWITGESYAGHYIPTLAAKIIEHNHKLQSYDDAINLKGLMLGNALTVGSIDFGTRFDFEFYHQLISKSTYDGIRNTCNLTFENPLPHPMLDPAQCMLYMQLVAEEIGHINAYAIYSDVCLENQRYSYSNGEALLRYLSLSKSETSIYASSLLQQMKLKAPYYPCQGNYIQSYLNDPAVQKAIHAERTKWMDCSTTLNYRHSDEKISMLPIYTNILFPEDLKILIYSGDVDTVICSVGSRRWIRELDLKLLEHWHPWMDSNGQVGGYTEVYDQMTFATVRNAGHQVPSFQPGRAYDMFSHFLNRERDFHSLSANKIDSSQFLR